MKKIGACFLVILMLCGCKSNHSAMDQAIYFRQRLLSSDTCRFDCEITADYGDVIYTFLIQCEFDSQGSMNFTVIEPESIADISGIIRSDGGELTFDDSALAFPLLADGYISPISAPWVFMKALRSGYIDSCGSRDDGLLLVLNDSYEENPLQIQVYADEQCLPQNAEILWQGRKILSLTVNQFSCL